MHLSIFSSEELPAKTIRSRDCASEWLGVAGNSPSHMLRLLQDIGPAGSFGRMSPASCPVTRDETSRAFWATSAASRSACQQGGGKRPASSPVSETLTDSSIACWTLNMCEHADSEGRCPSDGAVCSLSDILETGDVPPQYYLTARACLGILRRAGKRGKDMPQLLRRALEAVAGSALTSKSTED